MWSNLCRVSSCFDIWRLVAQVSIGHRLSYQSAANWICSDNLQRRSQIAHVLPMYTYYIWVKAHIFSIMFCLSCHSPQKQDDKSQCCNCNRCFWLRTTYLSAFLQVSYSIHNGGAAEPAIEVRVFFFLVFGWHDPSWSADPGLPRDRTPGIIPFMPPVKRCWGIKLDSQTCIGKMALFAFFFLRKPMHELRLVSYSGPDTEIVLNTLKIALERERLVEDKKILFSLTGLYPRHSQCMVCLVVFRNIYPSKLPTCRQIDQLYRVLTGIFTPDAQSFFVGWNPWALCKFTNT